MKIRPYDPGDRVLHRSGDPGILTVISCEPHPAGGWAIHYRCGAAGSGITYDDRVVPAPAGYVGPPPRALSAVERLELSTDGKITPAQWRAARAEDANAKG